MNLEIERDDGSATQIRFAATQANPKARLFLPNTVMRYYLPFCYRLDVSFLSGISPRAIVGTACLVERVQHKGFLVAHDFQKALFRKELWFEIIRYGAHFSVGDPIFV